MRGPLTSPMVFRKPLWIWFWSDHCKFSMVFEETITIEYFSAVWPLLSMVFQWFLILLPSLSMVFDGSVPLVKRCDGFDGSLWSSPWQERMQLWPEIQLCRLYQRGILTKKLDVSRSGTLGPLWTCHSVNTWNNTGETEWIRILWLDFMQTQEIWGAVQ